MPEQTTEATSPNTALLRVVGLAGYAAIFVFVFLLWAELHIGNSKSHLTNVIVLSSLGLLAGIVPTAMDTWWLRRSGARMTLTLAIADLALTGSFLAALVLMMFGGVWLPGLGTSVPTVAVPLTAWLIRQRTRRGAWDGSVALVGFLVMAGIEVSHRPWGAGWREARLVWFWPAEVSFAVAALVALNLALELVRSRTLARR